MRTNDIVARIAKLAEPLVHAQGLTLWGVDMLGMGQGLTVRIFVERAEDHAGQAAAEPEAAAEAAQESDAEAQPEAQTEAGVDIDRLARLSRQIGLVLDVEDMLPGAYRLELSSPGFERQFFAPAQLAGYEGQKLEAKTHEPVEGRKNFSGQLLSVELPETEGAGARFTLEVDGRSFALDWDNVRKVRLVVEDPWAYTKARRARR